MPSYEYKHKVEICNHEWEEWKSITKCMPTSEDKCPKCGQAGDIELQVSGGSGKGVVELTGRDYINKVKADAKDFKREVYSNENTYANVLGNDKYQQLQTQMDKRKR